MRGMAEYAWQAAGRCANTVGFVLLAERPGSTLQPLSAALSAVTAGYCGYRLLTAKIGNETCAQKLLVALGTAATATAGGLATAYGWASPALAMAAGAIVNFAVTGGMRQAACTPPLGQTVAMPALFAATTGATLAVLAFVPSLHLINLDKLPRRSLALLAESVVTEFCKGTTERTLPRFSREGMSFERRLKVALMGLLPYALASISFNGALGNLLRAQMRSDQFDDLMIPMLAGALANVVKGMVNTAVQRWELGDTASVQSPECPSMPERRALFAKTALRYLIAHARDVLYLSLVDHGMDELSAACTAYTLYAFFAQHRELMFDLMQGDGWSEPRLLGGTAPSST